jgi:uncharacterized phage protein (TIGR01671 family)
MREVKFKAWVKDTKVILPVWVIDVQYKRIQVYASDDEIWIPLEDVELMQYTGLHDKNGKEIWEGDVVKDIYGLWYIKWLDDCAKFVAVDLKDPNLTTDLIHPELFEVVGNIYEYED